MFVRLFKCVVKAALVNVPKAMLDALPFGNAICDFAFDVFKNWKQLAPRREERLAEVQELATASPDEVRRQAELAVIGVAAGQPTSLQLALVAYLTQVPGTVRQSLRFVGDPSGRTVPVDLPLDQPEDVLQFLPPRPPLFQPGVMLGDWELDELLGVGGFSEVWKAVNPHLAPVALKFCTDAIAARVLRNEAATIGRVVQHGRHPGIVALLDSCLSHDPPYLKYEYVSGGDIGRAIRSWKRIDPPKRVQRSLQMMRRLSRIVAFAHGKDIVHRDLKPANILLKPAEKGNYSLRVTDFGIGGTATEHARGQEGAGTSRGALMTALLRGAHTPLYASPEQIRGEPPDPRDDVHAMGVIWYQLLTGDPTSAASADWREELYERQVPDNVLNLLGRCMAAKASRRPEDAKALLDELKRLNALERESPEEKGNEKPSLDRAEDGMKVSNDLPSRVTQILKKYESERAGVYLAPTFPALKLNNAMEAAAVPPNEPLLALIDCTTFGSAKNCLVFGSRNFYYRHDGGSKPNPGVVPYLEFPACSFTTTGFCGINLNRASYFSMAGSALSLGQIVEVLSAIRQIVREMSAADAGR